MIFRKYPAMNRKRTFEIAVTRSGTFPSKYNSAYHAQQAPRNSVNKYRLKASKLTLSLAKIKLENGHICVTRKYDIYKLRRS